MLVKFHTTKPDGADLEDIALFVHDAVTSWGGCLRPDDPMFHSLTCLEIIVHGKVFRFIEDET